MDTNFSSKKARTRQRIVAIASKSVRRAGFNGVSVSAVMRDAGLTHGGFYAHFASKDALLAEALIDASHATGGRIRSYAAMVRQQGKTPFAALVEAYLSPEQIGDCENGCPVAALCADMRNQTGDVLEASRRAVVNLYDLVRELLPPECAPESAWSVAATMIGAVQMARTLGDNERGQQVLATARAELMARYQPGGPPQ